MMIPDDVPVTALPKFPVVKKTIIIDYDILDGSVAIPYNDFSTFEALGLLEAAKAMIADRWVRSTQHE